MVRFPGEMFIIVPNVECKIRLESDALLLAVLGDGLCLKFSFMISFKKKKS